MKSEHIMYMWIIITACICICIMYCNWLDYKNDKTNKKQKYTEIDTDTYDPDAMP